MDIRRRLLFQFSHTFNKPSNGLYRFENQFPGGSECLECLMRYKMYYRHLYHSISGLEHRILKAMNEQPKSALDYDVAKMEEVWVFPVDGGGGLGGGNAAGLPEKNRPSGNFTSIRQWNQIYSYAFREVAAVAAVSDRGRGGSDCDSGVSGSGASFSFGHAGFRLMNPFGFFIIIANRWKFITELDNLATSSIGISDSSASKSSLSSTIFHSLTNKFAGVVTKERTRRPSRRSARKFFFEGTETASRINRPFSRRD
ncbi:hypothetical protein SDJN02_27121, partial [Cucurbita argyrosperma subsp. argyrosperma]